MEDAQLIPDPHMSYLTPVTKLKCHNFPHSHEQMERFKGCKKLILLYLEFIIMLQKQNIVNTGDVKCDIYKVYCLKKWMRQNSFVLISFKGSQLI